MNYNSEKNIRIFELITMVVVLLFLVFIFIKFLYF
jgi:uncharacterized membrane protein